jgi:hypothetical protein
LRHILGEEGATKKAVQNILNYFNLWNDFQFSFREKYFATPYRSPLSLTMIEGKLNNSQNFSKIIVPARITSARFGGT